MNTDKKVMACFGTVLAACILFWGWLLAGQQPANERFSLDSTNVLAAAMREEEGSQIFSCVLPAEFETSQSLLFKSTHARVEVFLDGSVVYTFGMQKPVVGKSPGTHWHVVSLPENSAGRELIIRRTPVYAFYKRSDLDVYYGSRGDCILHLVKNFLYVLIMNCVIIVLGLISLLLHLRVSQRKNLQIGSTFLWVGLFALMIAVWSLRQSGFLQFVIPYSEVLYFVDIHMLALVACPLNLFVYSICKTKWGKALLWFVPVYLVGVVGGTAAQIAGLIDIVELLRALHVFLVINAVYMVWAIHREAWEYKDSMASRFRTALYAMLLFGVLELIHYYDPARGASIFLPAGVTVFILMLIWQQVEEYYHILEKQKLLYYEKLANTDMLTGAFNRNAYENMLKQLAPEESKPGGYGVVLFDLNDLKRINDNYGHEKGDEAIKRCHDLILTAFGDKENCYRIGGDEFLLLVLNETDIEDKIAYFDRLVAQNQERLEYPFSVALGYAAFDAAQDRDLQNTIRRSDAVMYLDKKKKKHLLHEVGAQSVF